MKKKEREETGELETSPQQEDIHRDVYLCPCVVVCLHSPSFSVVSLAVCGIQCLSNPPGNIQKLPKCHPAPLFTLYHPCLSISISLSLFLHSFSTPPFLSLAVAFIPVLPDYSNITQFHFFTQFYCICLPTFLSGL